MVSLPKYTFINGPVGSGKSTLASLLCKADPSLWRESFANPIREMLLTVFFPEENPISPSLDLRSGEVKQRILPYSEASFSIRKAMISFSEDWMKPKFGNSIFGKLAFARCTEQEMFYDRFVFDDSGFAEEAEYIISQVGVANCTLIRLHRPECNFSNDSRTYISLPCKSVDIQNEGTTTELLTSVEVALAHI